MKSIVISLFIFGILATVAFAQSEYVDYGQNAVGAAVSFGHFEDGANGIGFSIGLSSRGLADINLSYLNVEKHGVDLNAKTISAAYYILKEGRWGMPFSFGLGVGYTITFLNDYPSATAVLLKNIPLSGSTNLQFSFAQSSLDPLRNERYRIDQSAFGLSAFFNRSKHVIFIKPEFVITKDDNFVGISAGFLLKIHHR